MSLDIAVAPVRKSVTVKAPIEIAFEVFTTGIDRWWPKSHGIGEGAVMRSVIEPFTGGRWYATYSNGTEVSNGHVLAWEPPQRVVFSWEISAEWKSHPGAGTSSEIEVNFIAEAPGVTRVDMEHRHFERMAGGAVMRAAVDGGWPGLLLLFAKAAEEPATVQEQAE